jgi:hypothetical protein
MTLLTILILYLFKITRGAYIIICIMKFHNIKTCLLQGVLFDYNDINDYNSTTQMIRKWYKQFFKLTKKMIYDRRGPIVKDMFWNCLFEISSTISNVLIFKFWCKLMMFQKW